jgi:conjugal transfer ATP-binding protein TraC
MISEDKIDNMISNLIKPNHIINKPNVVEVNKKLNRILMAVGYPRYVELGFLDRIISAKGDFDISMHIYPSSIDSIRVKLNNLFIKQKSDLISANKDNINIPSLQIKHDDTYNLLRQVEKGEEKIFDISLYINAKAKTMDNLDLLTKKVSSDLNGIGIVSKEPTFRMNDGLKSILPLATDVLKKTRSLTTSALAQFFPFTSAYLSIDEGQYSTILGIDKNTGLPVARDPYAHTNPNMLVTATSGAGKSYFIKLHIAHQVRKGVKTMIIDPEGEYTDLVVSELGGKEIKISKDSDTMINIFDLMGFDYDEKLLDVMNSLNIILEGLSTPQKSVLDDAIIETYRRVGITKERSTWNNIPPTLKNLWIVLQEMKLKIKDRQRLVVFEAILLRLKPYVKGAYSFMNKPTKMDADSHVINFNIKQMPRATRPIIMYLICNYARYTMHKYKEPKLLAMDEAWLLLSHANEAPFILEMVKTSRKHYLSLLLIVQEVNDLISSDKVGRSVLANTSFKVLFRQDPSVIDDIVSKFKLNQREKDILLTASVGEGILIVDSEHTHIKVIASKEDDKIITTKPKNFVETKLIPKPIPQPTIKQEVKEDTSIDVEIGLFKEEILSESQIETLKKHGYVRLRQPQFTRGRGIYWWIKPKVSEKQESLKHLFVTKIAEQYIRKFTDKIKLYQTADADIVFETKDGKKIAIEVETGQVLRKPDQFQNKLRLLKERYGNNYIFLVTDYHLKKKYAEYGKTIVRSEIREIVKKFF